MIYQISSGQGPAECELGSALLLNYLRRKRANLPAEKTLESFDFGFQRSVSRKQMRTMLYRALGAGSYYFGD